ncbi:MAG: polyprenol monophosphomannose synthase [Ancrocorticia sp.]|uniref:polyprenol monophosphomannose synthase n=1 Tax=Ancrocorticia sp. TaxID=2593684 RepID=UPI003F8FE757
MKVLVTIPTYNEAESLPHIVERVRTATPHVEILVVDDNSPDGTGQIADRLAAQDPGIHVLHRAGKEGLGRAYIAAFQWALGRDYTHVVEMDADGSHRPEQLPALLGRALAPDGPALVIGSRYVRGGELVGWPKYRELLSRAGNLYIKACLGLPASDVTAGYRVYRADILRLIELDSVEATGYFFQTAMTDRVHACGGKIAEVPISFAQREAGESKLSGNIFVESFLTATRMGATRRASQVKKLFTSFGAS